MERGTYALLLRLAAPRPVSVGRLYSLRFPAGYYVYIGSALGGLKHRLARHLRREKVLRWHVDYLREVAEVEEVWVSYGVERLECVWLGIIGHWPGARFVAPGFGSSDCRCPAHLVYFSEKPGLADLGGERWEPS